MYETTVITCGSVGLEVLNAYLKVGWEITEDTPITLGVYTGWTLRKTKQQEKPTNKRKAVKDNV